MAGNNKELSAALRKLLQQDKRLLLRNDVLIEELKKQVSASCSRDVQALQMALQNADFANLMLATTEDNLSQQEAAKARAEAILSKHMNQARGAMIIDMVAFALDWHEGSAAADGADVNAEEALAVSQEMPEPHVAENNNGETAAENQDWQGASLEAVS